MQMNNFLFSDYAFAYFLLTRTYFSDIFFMTDIKLIQSLNVSGELLNDYREGGFLMIGTTLKNLLDERGVSVPELARRTGASTQTLYSIIKRDNMKIDFDLLLRICGALEVPVGLFYDKEPQGMLTDISELAFLKEFRALDEHGKKLTRMVMKAEAERISESEGRSEKSETKIVPLYYTPAAAGYASPALGEDYEDYEVPSDSEADFAARIAGDSMEPVIPDGSIVLVRRGANLVDGEVGLFFVDGDMKCKQFCQDGNGNVYLFSINRSRSDADVFIPGDSGVTLCCFGKVLLKKRPELPNC